MHRTRRAGLVVAAVGALLWLLFLVAVLTADPADGANIGAGLAALLALPVSVAALITLLMSLRSRSDVRASRSGAAERTAAVLAVLSVACLVAFLVLDPYTDSDVLRTTTLAVGIGAFLLSSGTFAFTTRAGHASG